MTTPINEFVERALTLAQDPAPTMQQEHIIKLAKALQRAVAVLEGVTNYPHIRIALTNIQKILEEE